MLSRSDDRRRSFDPQGECRGSISTRDPIEVLKALLNNALQQCQPGVMQYCHIATAGVI